MARVNLEDQLFGQARLKRFARLIGYPEQMALGMLGFLWHDSQEYEVAEAMPDEISEWCRLDDLQSFERVRDTVSTTQEKLITALEQSRFISKADSGRFLIHGNDTQIEALAVYRTEGAERKRIASLGGQARAEKASRNASGKFESVPADIQLPEPAAAGPATSRNSIQFNSIQFNAIQSNAKQCNLEKVPAGEPAGPTPGSLVWKAYSDAYEKKYLEKPASNAKQNSLCKQITQRIPADEAPEVAQFYLGLAGFYAQRGHPLGLLLQDCEKIRTEWKTGRVIKPDRAKTFAEQKSEANRELYQQVCEGKV